MKLLILYKSRNQQNLTFFLFLFSFSVLKKEFLISILFKILVSHKFSKAIKPFQLVITFALNRTQKDIAGQLIHTQITNLDLVMYFVCILRYDIILLGNIQIKEKIK